MKLKLTLPLCLALLLPACVPSVNPLYTEKDLVFDPALIGVWTQDHDKETWTFEKSGEKKYKLLQTDGEGRTAEFEIHLVKLNQRLFLDLYLIDPGMEKEWKMNQYAMFGLILRPAHMFMKVTQIEPALQISFLNPDWLKVFLAQNPRSIRHENVRAPSSQGNDEQILLTAETKDLQKFILKHVNDENAFGKSSDMKRKNSGS